ncbi:cobyrinic acid a,c-diamide synthase [Hydrogenoanaerobacterium saccharovorans]|uniref:Cobyrinate a,c-diamide synthase n=1 Tax=Hydrogenoanaerobacterium saccharovorans TaxID=474960 RepID=A0A1H8A3Y2_9FIRM|nr:cobyrinate a,c-diamide synthase [Hydrogenoanaerobacterium saccharovorans]RPF48187.1 cobyrinic acid a,c-diamide synthase [Hydrogenoanaerobacterium saccharovorans]SEM65216.1 cobyrinic acid a,c-diamide synthase [Hydrogenoanaerobacterium saccharovorans]
MNGNVPRIMFAAANSGAGKTTVTCAVLQAFVNHGLKLASFKCGPDYIDPMFHSQVIGAKSRNLDLFFYSENTANYLLAKNAAECDLSILEGVMGFYDGVGGTTTQASSYHLAKATATPVVLVLNVQGMSLSAAAQVKGFLSLRDDNNIKAVVLNRCNSMTYPMLKQVIEEETGISVAGYLPNLKDCSLESRHLGLVTASEIQNLKQKLQELAAQAEQTINLGFLLELAQTAQKPTFTPPKLPVPLQNTPPLRVAVARDNAFCFYYEDSLDLLRELGAELVEFSPIADTALPSKIDGLFLGGGYPEIYAEQLTSNKAMLQSVYTSLQKGLPCIAECGGFMYLHQSIEGADGLVYPMVGIIDAKSFNTHKLCRFGYANLTAQCDSMLHKAGEVTPAHEFHYWDSTDNGNGVLAQKPTGNRSWQCVHANSNLYAGYPHMHFYSQPNLAYRFLKQCDNYRKVRDLDDL